MQKKSKKPLIIVAAIISVLFIFIFCCLFSSILIVSAGSMTSGEVIRDGKNDQQIAVIQVSGVITSVPTAAGFFTPSQEDMVSLTIKKIEAAKNNKNIKAVILEVDSPGGEVYGSQLIYNELLELKEEKPIITLMKDSAASGGYYIAAPSNKIVAASSTITGSIGVIFQIQNLDGLYDKLGIKMISVTNSEGNFKTLSGEDLSNPDSEGYKVLESIADDTYNQFVDAIASGRNMSREEVIKIADGRVYSGTRAKEIGLVDEIGYMEDAIEVAKSEANLDDPKVYYSSENSSSYFGSIDSKFSTLIDSVIKVSDPQSSTGEIKIMYILPY